MTEEAMNLVSKLIEEDAAAGGGIRSSRLGGGRLMDGLSLQQQQKLLQKAQLDSLRIASGMQVEKSSSASSNSSSSHHHHHPSQQNISVHPPIQSPSASSASSTATAPHPQLPVPQTQQPAVIGSSDIWFYRDPQGSVQGPFSTHEMGLWCSQGYFTGSLQLRRECDKIFISLLEMGKVYGRNPFVASGPESAPPPPIQVI
jgi:hypothetical protein